MEIGRIDLDPRCKYMVVYKDKRDNTFNTWTLGSEFSLQLNYRQMKESGYIEFIGIYQKLNDSQLLDIMTS